MIRVACPHCNRSFRTRTEGMGKTGICTGCGDSFRIGEVRLPFQWESADLGEDSWIGVLAPAEKKEAKSCIICGGPMEHGQLDCTECGANQVTGIVRQRRRQPDSEPSHWYQALPLRGITIGIIVLALLGGVWWIGAIVARSIGETADISAHVATVRDAARYIEAGEPETISARLGGYVDNERLPGFLSMLSAKNRTKRQAVIALVGCGSMTDLRPILELNNDDQIDELLTAIGGYRLIELSNRGDFDMRRAAAEAMCRMNQLDPTSKTLTMLAEPISDADKRGVLNVLCRPWPEAVGSFVAVIDGEESPELVIEQLGRTFWLWRGPTRVQSLTDRERTFEIPIATWCAITGTAVQRSEVRRLLTGSVWLGSPVGAGWEGLMTVTTRTKLEPPLPGFLPLEPPSPGQTMQIEFTLERPR